MSSHWEDVEECAGLLAFCTTRYDNDGIDLSFMFSDKEKNTKGDESIIKQVQNNKPPDIRPGSSQKNQLGNINAVLGKILRDYQQKVVQHCKGGPYAQELKKLVLFVLTDGLWLPHSDAREPLKDLADTLARYKLPRNQVGVQFILSLIHI